jgi:hypothetical protein
MAILMVVCINFDDAFCIKAKCFLVDGFFSYANLPCPFSF